jgi:hypothetical protein
MAEAQMPANIKNFNDFELRFATHNLLVNLGNPNSCQYPGRHPDMCGTDGRFAYNLE